MEAAACELQQFEGKRSGKEEREVEACSGHTKRGGWTTFPFVTGSPSIFHSLFLSFFLN